MKLSYKKKLLFYTLTLILLILGLEIGLQAINFIKQLLPLSQKESMVSASVYQNQDWAQQYSQEFDASYKTTYQPFYEWRRPEFHGQYINISADGIRKTWNPEFTTQQPYTIYMLGGSTLWGTGARDDFTIPSLLSKKLNQSLPQYQLVNLGESGYVLNQEIIYLVNLLQQGHRPNLVIFYDGINDIYSAYQNGYSGQIQNLHVRQEKLSSQSTWEQFRSSLLVFIDHHYLTLKAIKNLQALINPGHQPQGAAASSYQPQQLDSLAHDIVDDYRQNIDFINSLSQAFGFHYLFIWQPVLYTNPQATTEELAYQDWQDQSRVKLFQLTYDLIDQSSLDNFYNFSHLLDNKSQTLFIDFCHLSESGNQIIADKIYQTLIQEYSF